MSAGRKNNADKKNWNTPPEYISLVKDFFGGEIELDPCSNSSSLVEAKNNFYEEDDGLKKDWNFKSIFVNPPYGRNGKTSIYDWIEKGIFEYLKFKCEIIFLIPVATNTRHFKSLIFKNYDGICFLNDTRLKFYENGEKSKKGAPMACCLVYKGDRYDSFSNLFSKNGKCFRIR